MIDPVVDELRKILLGLVTNSEQQATRWASVIVERLREAGISVEENSVLEQLIEDCRPQASD